MLDVPLQAHRKPVNGVENLVLWNNGEEHTVPAPIWPYVIALKPIKFNDIEFEVEQIKVKPLDSFKEQTAYKYSFPVVSRIIELNNELKNRPKGIVRENHIDFIERCAIDRPEFFQQYKEKLDSVLTFDIETASDGKKYYDEIIAIGVNNGKETWVHTGDEEHILESFRDDWKRTDPDCIVTYNGKEFDLPRVLARAQRYGISDNWVARKQYDIRANEWGRIHTIPGRCMFDVFDDVGSDQTLFGLKNRKLKTVAAFMGIDAITEDTSNTLALSEEDLIRYCASDVDVTAKLFKTYAYRTIAIANTIVYPFDALVNPKGAKDGRRGAALGRTKAGSATLIGRIVIARGMGKRGFIENGMNRDRFPEFYLEGKPFQGAIPELFKQGYFDNILHLDIKSMYPNIQMSVNISPETTSLVGIEPYNQTQKFLRERGKDYVIFCVPDANLKGSGRNAIIKVDQSFYASGPEFLEETTIKRDEYKTKYTESKGTEMEDIYWSAQYGMKVTLNSVGFGINSPPIIRYGSFWVAVLITGIARFIIDFAMKWLVARGFILLEVDTDGTFVTTTKEIDPDQVLADLNEAITEEVSRWGNKPSIEMELDLYDCAYFYKTKNYILRTPEGELKFKGSSFLDSKKPLFCDSFRDTMAEMILDQVPKDEVKDFIKQSMRIEKYSLKELTKRITMTKWAKDYTVNHIAKQMAVIHKELMGEEPPPYTRFEYILQNDGPMLVSHASLDDINMKAYRNMIRDTAELFGYGEIAKQYARNPGLQPVAGGWF